MLPFGVLFLGDLFVVHVLSCLGYIVSVYVLGDHALVASVWDGEEHNVGDIKNILSQGTYFKTR